MREEECWQACICTYIHGCHSTTVTLTSANRKWCLGDLFSFPRHIPMSGTPCEIRNSERMQRRGNVCALCIVYANCEISVFRIM